MFIKKWKHTWQVGKKGESSVGLGLILSYFLTYIPCIFFYLLYHPHCVCCQVEPGTSPSFLFNSFSCLAYCSSCRYEQVSLAILELGQSWLQHVRAALLVLSCSFCRNLLTFSFG